MKIKNFTFKAVQDEDGETYILAEPEKLKLIKIKLGLNDSMSFQEAEELAGYLRDTIKDISSF